MAVCIATGKVKVFIMYIAVVSGGDKGKKITLSQLLSTLQDPSFEVKIPENTLTACDTEDWDNVFTDLSKSV